VSFGRDHNEEVGPVDDLEWLLVEQDRRQFRVRQAGPGEVVATPRGWEIAQDGDWVMAGDEHDRWVISTATLQKYFRVVASLVVP